MLENISLADEIKRIIAEQFCVEVAKISNETSFIKDLKADSLDIVETILVLEEQLNIEIPDSDVENMTTVGEIIGYIEEKARAVTKQ